MGVHYDESRGKYVVRWKADGRRRVRRFESELEAIAFAESVARPEPLGPRANGSAASRSALACGGRSRRCKQVAATRAQTTRTGCFSARD
jgi:hypothetical protein